MAAVRRFMASTVLKTLALDISFQEKIAPARREQRMTGAEAASNDGPILISSGLQDDYSVNDSSMMAEDVGPTATAAAAASGKSNEGDSVRMYGNEQSAASMANDPTGEDDKMSDESRFPVYLAQKGDSESSEDEDVGLKSSVDEEADSKSKVKLLLPSSGKVDVVLDSGDEEEESSRDVGLKSSDDDQGQLGTAFEVSQGREESIEGDVSARSGSAMADLYSSGDDDAMVASVFRRNAHVGVPLGNAGVCAGDKSSSPEDESRVGTSGVKRDREVPIVVQGQEADMRELPAEKRNRQDENHELD